MPKVLVFPRDPNPYQERLHQALPDAVHVHYMDVMPDSRLHALLFAPRLLGALIAGRLRGYRIFHLHWLYPFTLPRIIPGRRFFSLVQTLFFIYMIRALGYKLVWTVHNVLPHEPQTTNDRLVARRLAAAAHAAIVHSTAAISQMEEQGMDTRRTHVIPHASYIGAYPETISRTAARARLGLQPHDRAVLFFGIIRPHKGVEKLIATFDAIPLTRGGRPGGTPRTRSASENHGGILAGQDPHPKLVIAGKCTDPILQKTLDKARENRDIIIYDRFIPDDDVAMYFKAADVVCLPFKAVTTSGSALLALSFGKALVAPRAGALLDIPADAALLYDTPDKLSGTLQTALQDTRQTTAAGKAARRYAETLSQQAISAKTARVYAALIGWHVSS